jgi:hypothetical protein
MPEQCQIGDIEKGCREMLKLTIAAALAMLSPALSLTQSNTQAEQLLAHARNVQCGSTEPVNPWDVAVAMPESPQLQALSDTLSDLVKVKNTDNLVKEHALIEEEKIAVRQWRCRMGAGR